MGTAALPGDAISTLLAEHPWPAAYAGERRLEWLWTFDVAAPRRRLWPLIADMSRLNHALGNPEMHFEERGGQRFGRGRYGGVMHAWREVPWNWVANRWYTLSREYTQGAMRALYSVHRFDDLPDGRSRLSVYFGVVPRWGWISPGLKLSFGAIGRAYRRLLTGVHIEGDQPARPAIFDLPLPTLRPEAASRLRAIEAALAEASIQPPIEPGLVDKLAGLVRGGDELELARIQVRERARAWNVDEHALLRAALHATRAGMLELTWDVVCPHCRGVREATTSLAEVAASGSCEPCGVTFGTSDAIEISFRAHPALREFVQRTFCSAEASRKAHMAVQHAVPAGAEVTVTLDLAPGRYRLRRAGQPPGELDGLLDVGGAAAAPPRTVRWQAGTPVEATAVAGDAQLTLHNPTASDVVFVVEESRPTDLALKPARLLAHPDFRDLFSDQYLAADVGLSVGEQTILFTDIVGSTAMYLQGGDPGAFVTVKNHFTKVFALVAEHRGAVIKTIGDAVMAAFTDPLDAVRASAAIQRAFAGAAEPLRLRISLNTGPCIAVKLNAGLDFFGNTVNLAAKLQAIAESGQVGLSDTTLEAPGVRAFVERNGEGLVAEQLALKGIAAPLAAWRWDVWR